MGEIWLLRRRMHKDLLLTTEQLNEIVWNNTDKEKQAYALGTIIQQIAQAELEYLANPEMNIYVYQGADIYVPLADYIKKDDKNG